MASGGYDCFATAALTAVVYGKTQVLSESCRGIIIRILGEPLVIKRLPVRTNAHRRRALREIEMLSALQSANCGPGASGASGASGAPGACTHPSHDGLLRALGFVEHRMAYDILMPCYRSDLMHVVERAAATRLTGLLVATARNLYGQLVQAVAHLHHAHGIAHRDISCENVLLQFRGTLDDVVEGRTPARVVLADWADAAHIGDGAVKGLCGKKTYVAPEVYCGRGEQPYDACAADVWSCGALLFLLLSGTPAYTTPTDDDAYYIQLMRGGSRVALSELLQTQHPNNAAAATATLQKLDGGADALVDRMLCFSPLQRPHMCDIARDAWLLVAAPPAADAADAADGPADGRGAAAASADVLL